MCIRDRPTTVWVDNSLDPENISDFSATAPPVPDIADLLAVVTDLSEGFELTEFAEGEFGEPERITIERTGDARPLFCFELIEFDGSNRDDEGRFNVPARRNIEVSPDGRTLEVNVPSCNGDPSVSVLESEETVTFMIETRIPSGSSRDDCLDSSSFELDSPVGDRTVIDGFGGRAVLARSAS